MCSAYDINSFRLFTPWTITLEKKAVFLAKNTQFFLFFSDMCEKNISRIKGHLWIYILKNIFARSQTLLGCKAHFWPLISNTCTKQNIRLIFVRKMYQNRQSKNLIVTKTGFSCWYRYMTLVILFSTSRPNTVDKLIEKAINTYTLVDMVGLHNSNFSPVVKKKRIECNAEMKIIIINTRKNSVKFLISTF